jgi:hypothetical protein
MGMDTVGQLGKEIPKNEMLGDPAAVDALLAKRKAEAEEIEKRTKERQAELEKLAGKGEVVH